MFNPLIAALPPRLEMAKFQFQSHHYQQSTSLSALCIRGECVSDHFSNAKVCLIAPLRGDTSRVVLVGSNEPSTALKFFKRKKTAQDVLVSKDTQTRLSLGDPTEHARKLLFDIVSFAFDVMLFNARDIVMWTTPSVESGLKRRRRRGVSC